MKRIAHLSLLLLLLLTIPTFSRMIRFGIFTQHDFHIFRLYEFNKCIRDFVFPCRWAPDSGMGYGEPVFNFYPQVPYWLGEPFVLSGLSILNSNKISFAISLFASAVSMYVLALFLWKNKLAALVSGILYVYAPYRAVDVWVRGALPESLAFVLYPAIVYFFEKYLSTQKYRFLAWFSLSLAALFLTHNLSFLMFLLFLVPYFLSRLYQTKSYFIPQFILCGLLVTGLTAFQLLPVIFEMKFITLGKTLEGYYDYHAHFVSLRQLFIDRTWGYGASVWGDQDDLNLSVGLVQWMLPPIALFLVWKNKDKKQLALISLITAIGFLSLFLIHTRSTFIWDTIPGLDRLQFPWRFLSIAVFSLSLAGGFLVTQISKKIFISTLIIISVIALNASFFREDIWLPISDEDYFTGGRWNEQRASALHDFWPKYGNSFPADFAPNEAIISPIRGRTDSFIKNSHSADLVVTMSQPAEVIVPIVYFPGWKAFSEGSEVKIVPANDESISEQLGQISFIVPGGHHSVKLLFTETPVRKLGNLLSLLSLAVAVTMISVKKLNKAGKP